MDQKEITKKEAVDEINKTVLFLLRERDKGKGEIDISEFLDNKLEKNIIENFDRTISKDEYEELIFKIFKGKDIKIGKFDFKDINSFLEDLILKQNFRDKNKIIEKINDRFNIQQEQVNRIKKYILSRYRYIASDYLKGIFFRELSEGTINDEELLKIGKKERFKVNSEDIKNIIIVQKRKYQSEQKLKFIEKDKDKISDIEDELHQRRIKSFSERLIKMKTRFIDKYCKTPKFDLIENNVIEGKRNFLHKCLYGGTEIYVRSISEQGEIENVIIEFKRMVKGEKKTAKLDIYKIRSILEEPDGLKTFTQKLKGLNFVLNFPNFQEVVWFLGNFMTEQNYIPQKTAQFLKENFKDHVEKLDETLFKYTIQKSSKFV